MTKIECKCGTVLRYGEIPNPIEWLIIQDVAYDKFSGGIDSEELYQQMKSMLRCPTCERLWIFWGGFNQPASCYSSDSV